MKKFRFLENIATADSAFEAYGGTLSELFENAALALFEVMVETKTVKKISNFKFQISNFQLEDLLLDFLSELVFLKDEKGTVFSQFKVKIKRLDGKSLTLQAEVWGEKINLKRHALKVDVKAVTRHLFGIKKEKNKYKATVVLDI